jgi:hypothetical protein
LQAFLLSQPRLRSQSPENRASSASRHASIQVSFALFPYNLRGISDLGRLVVWVSLEGPKDESEKSLIISKEKEKDMRSDRVFDALHTLRNRYMLCQLASKATRKFHRPSTRIQETMNVVLDKIAGAERQAILSEPENVAEAQRRAA